jgi:N-acetylmuramoyl-L-alanine amidase
MAYSELELLARLIQCEAGGEGDNGMRAVAGVVMNRVRIDYGEYGRLDTIHQVIFQRRQFVCAMETDNGEYNAQNIYNMRPEAEHYAIAEWAIAGNRLDGLGYALWFFNPFSSSCRPNFPSRVGEFVLRIGDHCFYNPTSYYAQT